MIKEVSILRVFAMLLVVFYHCIAFYTPSWGNVECYPIHLYTCYLLNSFHLPVFVFLSGYLYSNIFNLGKYNDTGHFYTNKIKRLLIPYTTVGILLLFLLPNRCSPIDLLNGISHLWFLVMLFNCFVIFHSLRSIWGAFTIKKEMFVLLLFFIFHMFSLYMQAQPRALCIGYTLQYSFWFYLGMVFQRNQDAIDRIVSRLPKSVFVLSIMVLLLLISMNFVPSIVPYKIFQFLADIMVAFIIIYLYDSLKCNKLPTNALRLRFLGGGKFS